MQFLLLQNITNIIKEKPWILILIILLPIIILWYVSNKVRTFFTKIPFIGSFWKNKKELEEEEKREYGTHNVNKSELDYDLPTYKNNAEEIHTLLSAATFKSDEKRIINILEDKNLNELKEIINQFGTRGITKYTSENMIDWCMKDLKGDELEKFKIMVKPLGY